MAHAGHYGGPFAAPEACSTWSTNEFQKKIKENLGELIPQKESEKIEKYGRL